MSTTIEPWQAGIASLADQGLRDAEIPDPGGSGDGSPGESSAIGFIEAFRDGCGHRRPTDIAFLRFVLGVETAADWWSTLAGSTPRPETPLRGPLFPNRQNDGIELWTELELSGLHAIWWLESDRDVAAVASRLTPLVEWHVDTLQPDNATQRPWAAHVFRIVAETTSNPSAQLHADQLVHASILRTGVPDVVSALVLRDAATAVDRWLRG